MNFKIDLNNIIAIDLTKEYYQISDMQSIKRGFLFDLRQMGYDMVWLEKYNGSHRLIAYKKNRNYSIDGKFLNNISNKVKESIFSIKALPIPTNSEYKNYQKENSDSIKNRIEKEYFNKKSNLKSDKTTTSSVKPKVENKPVKAVKKESHFR